MTPEIMIDEFIDEYCSAFHEPKVMREKLEAILEERDKEWKKKIEQLKYPEFQLKTTEQLNMRINKLLKSNF